MIPPEIPIEANTYFHSLAIADNKSGTGCKVFLDEDSLEKYYTFKKGIEKSFHHFVYELHHEGKYIPILSASYSMFSSDFVTVHRAKIPTIGFYDKDRDDSLYAKVKRQRRLSATKYEIGLAGQKIVLYSHPSFPIVDFAHKGRRFRWVYHFTGYRFTTHAFKYTYSLFEIDNGQPSLVDDLIYGEINKKNILVRNPVINLLSSLRYVPNNNGENFVSTRKICQFTYISEQSLFGDRNCTAKFEIATSHPMEGISDVDSELKMYLVMAITLKRDQDLKRKQRRRRSHHGNFM